MVAVGAEELTVVAVAVGTEVPSPTKATVGELTGVSAGVADVPGVDVVLGNGVEVDNGAAEFCPASWATEVILDPLPEHGEFDWRV